MRTRGKCEHNNSCLRDGIIPPPHPVMSKLDPRSVPDRRWRREAARAVQGKNTFLFSLYFLHFFDDCIWMHISIYEHFINIQIMVWLHKINDVLMPQYFRLRLHNLKFCYFVGKLRTTGVGQFRTFAITPYILPPMYYII